MVRPRAACLSRKTPSLPYLISMRTMPTMASIPMWTSVPRTAPHHHCPCTAFRPLLLIAADLLAPGVQGPSLTLSAHHHPVVHDARAGVCLPVAQGQPATLGVPRGAVAQGQARVRTTR